MADTFYVNSNAQSNGDHEVHRSTCSYLPAVENRVYLGPFDSCFQAVEAAKRHYTQVNGCYFCCAACHTS